jgi:hypothetical protein
MLGTAMAELKLHGRPWELARRRREGEGEGEGEGKGAVEGAVGEGSVRAAPFDPVLHVACCT